MRLSRYQALLAIKVEIYKNDKDIAACAFQRGRLGIPGATPAVSCLNKEGLHGTYRKGQGHVPGCGC